MILNGLVFTLGELARRVSGKVIGDASIEIRDIQPFDVAAEGHLTLASKGSLLRRLDDTRASAVIVGEPVEDRAGKSLLIASNPKAAFARLLQEFHQPPPLPGGIAGGARVGLDCRIHPDASIHDGAWIGEKVAVGAKTVVHAGVVVGDGCRLGSECTLYPNVTLYPGCTLGDRVIVHSGTVIGADGFGYVSDGKEQVKMPQTGTVTIEDDVEIGANSCVDRATFGETLIRRGAKLDNHVHVGHNCEVGERTIIVGQVGISGSSRIGSDCILAGHSGVSDNVKIGDGVRVYMKSAVSRDVPDGAKVSGQPAIDHRENLKTQALLRRLPEMYRQIRRLLKERDNRGKGNARE